MSKITKLVRYFSVAALVSLFAHTLWAAVGDSVSICNVGKGGYGASTFNTTSETYSFSIPASESAPTDSWVAVSSIAFGMNSSTDAAKTPKYVKINGVMSQIVNGTGNQVTNVKFDNKSLKQTYSFSGLIVQVGQGYTFEFCSDAQGTKMGEMRWYMVNSTESAPMAQSSTSPGWRITQEVTGKVVDAGVREYDGTLPSAEDCTYFSSDSWAGTVWLKNISKGNGYTANYWSLPFNYGNAKSTVRLTNVTAYLGNGTYNYAIELQDDESNIALTVNAGGAGHTSVFKLKGDGTLKNTYSQTHLFNIDAQTYGFTGSFDVGGKRFEIGSGTTAQQNQIVVDADQVVTIGDGSTWTATSSVVINGRVNVNGTISGTITGSGTAAYPTLSAADANKTSFQAAAWQGKLEIAPITTTGSTAVQFDFAQYGNENSTLVLKGLSGSAGRYLPGGTRIKPAVEVAGTVEINNGGWTANYYFDGGVTGSGDLKLLNWRGNDGFDKGYHIAKLFNYTGTLTATRATTIDELALSAEPEIGQKLVKLASGSTETLRVTSVTVNGQPLSGSKKIEITADGIYCRAGEVTSEETMDVFGYKNVGDIVIGNNGVQKFAGTAGIRTTELTIKNGGKLVNDPIKNPIYVTGGAPTLQDGAKIALAEKYAAYTKGVFTLMTWDGDTTSTTVIPEGLFEATEAQQTNGPKLSLETYTTHVDNSKGTAKTYTALKLDLDPNGVKPKLKIMPLGDSITEGSNPDGLANPNYRVILMAKMASLGYDVSSTGMRMIKNWNAAGIYQPMEWSWHSGVSGQTLVSTGSRAGWRDSLEAMLDSAEIPDIITFKIGTNDSLAGRDINQSVAEWVEVMRRIIKARPSTKIIVGSIMPFSNGGTWGSGENSWNAKLKAAIENNTYNFPEGQVFYAPLAENCLRTMDGKDNFVDSLHPNWTGHERNAETWATTITAALTAYPTAPGTYAPNEKLGAAENVGADYIKGFTKLAAYSPDNTVIAKDSEVNYSFKLAGLDTAAITKVGYYVELKNERSGNVRWVWADMDNWNEDKSFSKIAIPTAYTYCGSAQNLHVDSNDEGIEKIAPTVSGKTAWLQFTRGDLLKDTAAEGAPAAYSPRDWNDACDDSGNYGVMNLYRVAPTAVEGGVNALPAQVLMAYSRWTSDKQQIGVGNFMVHGQPLVYGNINDMPVNYYGTQDFERLNLASYTVANIEIWGVVDAAAKIGDKYYKTLQDAVSAAENGDKIELIGEASLEGLSVSGKAVIIVHTQTVDGATQYFLKLGTAKIGEQKDSGTIPLLNSVEIPGGDKISPAVNAECVMKYTYSSSDHTWKQPIVVGDLTKCVAIATGSEYIPTTTKKPYLISYFISKNITLDEDMELPLRTTISGSLNFCGDNLVLDLNGHTLKQVAFVNGYPAVAVKAGSLTIKDSVGNGKIIGATNGLNIENGAQCIVESGSIMTMGCWNSAITGSCIIAQSDAELQIKGGTFGDDSCYVENPKTSGTLWAMNATATITGGEFKSPTNEDAWDGTAICAYSYTAGKTASVTISGSPKIDGLIYPYQVQGNASIDGDFAAKIIYDIPYYYLTLAAALADAETGNVINVMKDVTAAELPTQIASWAKEYNVSFKSGSTIPVNALILNCAPDAIPTAEAGVLVDEETLEAILDAVAKDLDPTKIEIPSDIKAKYPMAKIEVIPAKELTSTETAKFFKLLLTLK